MVGEPVRSIIRSLKLGDYLSIQAHKPCSISHIISFEYQEPLKTRTAQRTEIADSVLLSLFMTSNEM